MDLEAEMQKSLATLNIYMDSSSRSKTGGACKQEPGQHFRKLEAVLSAIKTSLLFATHQQCSA